MIRAHTVAPLVPVLDSHCAMSGGQPVAAGDLQISDVAVMALMKLTQHSLPAPGPQGPPALREAPQTLHPPAAAPVRHAQLSVVIPAQHAPFMIIVLCG